MALATTQRAGESPSSHKSCASIAAVLSTSTIPLRLEMTTCHFHCRGEERDHFMAISSPQGGTQHSRALDSTEKEK